MKNNNKVDYSVIKGGGLNTSRNNKVGQSKLVSRPFPNKRNCDRTHWKYDFVADLKPLREWYKAGRQAGIGRGEERSRKARLMRKMGGGRRDALTVKEAHVRCVWCVYVRMPLQLSLEHSLRAPHIHLSISPSCHLLSSFELGREWMEETNEWKKETPSARLNDPKLWTSSFASYYITSLFPPAICNVCMLTPLMSIVPVC